MPSKNGICKKCYLPVEWDANRRVWVTLTGAAGCKAGGTHAAVVDRT